MHTETKESYPGLKRDLMTEDFSINEVCQMGLVTLTAVPLGLGSNPVGDMNVCKCIVSSRHGGTLNSLRAASPLERLVEGEKKWEAPDHPRVSPSKLWGNRAKAFFHMYGAQSYG
ncbi:uncharacterized protein TNCV_3652561 [Trichonephila clavipes]|nr:uncharacterized protein TNCV_3652561 [Trichonephila clavipes]